MKDRLTAEQSARLIELGVDPSKASLMRLDFNLPSEKESLKLSDVKEQTGEWFNSHTPEEILQKMAEYGMASSKESAVIEGWVARDSKEASDALTIYQHYPRKGKFHWKEAEGMPMGDGMILPKSLFPYLTWESEPLKVRIQITPME